MAHFSEPVKIGETYQNTKSGGEYTVFIIPRHPVTLKLAVVYGIPGDDVFHWRTLAEFKEEFTRLGGSNGG